MTQPHWVEEYFAPPGPALNNESTGTMHNVVTTEGPHRRRNHRFLGAAPTITGFASGAAGRPITIYAVGGDVVLKNENAGSLASNRIVTGTGGDLTIAEGAFAELVYDEQSTRWRCGAGGGGGGGGATLPIDLTSDVTGVLPLANQAIEPGSVLDIFGADLAHFWGDDYDGEAGTFGDDAGTADADTTSGPDDLTTPGQGSINGHACPVFNGIDDGLIGPDITTLDGRSSYVIHFCFRIDGGDAYGSIIEKGDSYQFGFQFSGQKLYAFVNNGAADITGVTSVNDGKWHRGILNVVAGAATLYLDGNVEGTATFPALDSGTTKGIQLGYQGGEPANTAMKGAIGAVGIVTRAATALEVQRLDRVLAAWVHGVDVPAGFEFTSFDTDNGTSPQSADEVDTSDATPAQIGGTFAIVEDAMTSVDISVLCIKAGATKSKRFDIRRSFLNTAGTITDGTQVDLITPEELGGSMAIAVDITRTDDVGRYEVTGLSSTDLRWYLISQRMRVSAAPGPAVVAPTVSSTTPNIGDTAGGGQLVTITGTSFTTATGATFGGVAATSFSVVDDTTITCIPPAHASGQVDVVVTNSAGPGTGTNVFEYWTPSQITGADAYFDADKSVTAVATAVGTWTDQKNTLAASQATGANKPAQIAAVFGTLPAIRFAKENWLDLAAGRLLASGASFFFVGKYTSTDNTAGTPLQCPPLTVVGWNNASSWGSFGCNAGALEYKMYNQAGSVTDTATKGSGLNDGTTRLLGITHDTSQNVKAYSGETQTGTTAAFTAAYPASFLKWGTLGNGQLTSDGFAGDIGAIIVVSGVISGGDLTKLHKWAQQRFGAV